MSNKYTAISKGNNTLGYTKFPDRKKPSLFVQTGNKIFVLGTFTSEKHAEVFYEYLCGMFDVQEEANSKENEEEEKK